MLQSRRVGTAKLLAMARSHKEFLHLTIPNGQVDEYHVTRITMTAGNLKIVGAFLFLILVAGCKPDNSVAPIFQQQVIPGELPDPSVIEVDGVFYASGSSNDWGPFFPIYRSTDLVHWTFVNYVFVERPSWAIGSFWAPELYHRDGKFYCYYTARRKDGIACIGVATTSNPAAGFQDHGVLIAWGNEAIDSFVYDDNGTLYITWKAYGLTPDKQIQILASELSADGLSLKGEAFSVVTADKTSWEAGGIEGQCIVRKDGFLYMLYSGNACCGGGCDYQVGVARAATMKGPWNKYEQNPILKSNADWKCPGHGTALETSDGWFYLYHAYAKDGFPFLGRSALLSQMFWQQSGWPYFQTEKQVSDSLLQKDVVDTFDADQLDPAWRYDVQSYAYSAKLERGSLHLEEIHRNTNAGAAICMNPDLADFSFSTKVSCGGTALKGLIVYATGTNSVGFGVRGDSLVLWRLKDSNLIVLNKIAMGEKQDVFLRGEVTQGHQVVFSYSTDDRQWNAVFNKSDNSDLVVGDNLAWWSWGIKAGLFVKSDAVSGDRDGVFHEFALRY